MSSRKQSSADDQDELRLLRERVERLEQENTQLGTSEERLQILFEHAPDGYYLSDLKGTFVDGNRAAERITGYTKGELIGKSFLKLKLLSAGDLPRAASLLARNVLGRSTGPDEFTLMRKDGAPIVVEIRTHPVRIGNRRLVLAIARDISVRKRAEVALKESQERFRDLIEHAHDLIQSVNPDGHFRYVNNAWLKTLGYSRSEIERLTLSDVLHPDSHDHCMQVFESLLAGETVDHVEAEFVSKAGDRVPVEGSVSCRFKDGQPFSTRAIFRDVTERRQHEAELARMARHDPLTGVLNRYAVDELLEQETRRSNRYAHSIGFLMIDVNRFKEINDRFGHAMGDKVLQAIAKVIQDNVRDADILVRYGGDEFLVILPETNGETEVVKDRILAEVARRNKKNPLLDFAVTLAIGSYHWSSESGRSIEEALSEADKLMYEDKRRSSAST
ncbi:PAS domain S-box protein [Candidatus Bipolaricaulota bacterium]|nr:PAS domain S-box protein [Candidatus Bipolaricaulota bacterium]